MSTLRELTVYVIGEGYPYLEIFSRELGEVKEDIGQQSSVVMKNSSIVCPCPNYFWYISKIYLKAWHMAAAGQVLF